VEKNGDSDMHDILRILHPFLAAFRMLRDFVWDTLYRLGPGMLAQHTMACGWLVCLLCLSAGCFDLVRRRRFEALLWAAMAGLLFTAFRYESTLSGFKVAPDFAIAAMAVGLLLLVSILRQAFRRSASPR
jgi:hypothetical protein